MTIKASSASYSGKNLQLYAEKQKLHVELNKAQISALDLRPKHAVLDIGCSDGSLSGLMAPFVSRVFGIDLSEESIARANMSFAGDSKLQFAVADARLFTAPQLYDRILLSMVCLAIPTEAELGCIFANAFKSLTPGGIVVFSDLHPNVIGRANWYNLREISVRDNFYLENPGDTYITRVQVLPDEWLQIENVSWFGLYAERFWEKCGFLLKETIDVPFYLPSFIQAPCQKDPEYKIWVLMKPESNLVP